jgi:hypothetical protein
VLGGAGPIAFFLPSEREKQGVECGKSLGIWVEEWRINL